MRVKIYARLAREISMYTELHLLPETFIVFVLRIITKLGLAALSEIYAPDIS